MKIKDLFLVWASYVAWNLVASLYASKKWKDLEKEIIKDKDNALKIVWNNFLDIHKKLFKDIWLEISVTDIEAKKKELLEIIDDFKAKWEVFLKEFREKGSWYIDEITPKLEKLYEEKKDIIEKYREEIPEFIEDSKKKLRKYLDDIRKEMKK